MSDRPAKVKKCRGPLTWLAGRSRRFWVAVALLIPVMYASGLGPAVWIVTQKFDDSRLEMFDRIYWPLLYAIVETPPALQPPLEWYLGLGAPAESKPEFWKDERPYFGIGWEYPKDGLYYTALSTRLRPAPIIGVSPAAPNPDAPPGSD